MMDITEWNDLITRCTTSEDYPVEYTMNEGGFWYVVADKDNLRLAHAIKFKSGRVIVRNLAAGNYVPAKTETNCKYNEEALLKEFRDYVLSTYKGHYVGGNNIQALDLIFAANRGFDFCVGNVLKYASRLEKKENTRADLLKILHYALLALFCWDDKKKETK